jgi:uncharacterized protein
VVLSLILEQKILKIQNILSNKKIIVAFSGGIDSTLLLLLAMKYSQKYIPVFFYGPIFTKEELDRASKLCKILKIQLEIMDHNPLVKEEFRINPTNRCYFCKKYIMKALQQVQKEVQFDLIVEGTNTSDLQGSRPGYNALQELGVISPFVLSNFSKSDIKDLMKYIISNPSWIIGDHSKISSYEFVEFLKKITSLPSNPCLCSRIEYGIEITEERLIKVYEAEEFLRNAFNLKTLRVRMHKNNLARIEIPQFQIINILTEEALKEITYTLKKIGFFYITLDLEGFRSGSLDLEQ